MSAAVKKAAKTLLRDLDRAISTDAAPDVVEAGRRWARASDAAETAPTWMTRPTPIQMIRAALQSLSDEAKP